MELHQKLAKFQQIARDVANDPNNLSGKMELEEAGKSWHQDLLANRKAFAKKQKEFSTSGPLLTYKVIMESRDIQEAIKAR